MSKSHFLGRSLKMQSLPGCEYWLYTMIRKHLGLESLREVFILGLRCVYIMWWDHNLRAVLMREVKKLKQSDLDHMGLEGYPSEEYQEFKV